MYLQSIHRVNAVSPWRACLVAAVLLLAACGPAPQRPAENVVGWKRVGAWSGRGNFQTETFTSDTGGFRVHWETKNETPSSDGGAFKVDFRSLDSGNVIMEAVQHRGMGRDTAYVGDRPRWYYLTIESANVDWSVTVEEPVIGGR